MNNIDWQSLLQYAAGECTPAERERLDRWLAENPKHAEMLASIRRAASLAGKTVAPERRTAMLARLRAEFAADGTGRRASPTLGLSMLHPRGWRATAMRVAATVAVVLGAGFVGHHVSRGPATPTANEGNYSVVSTTQGQRLSIQLPDSTNVVLAPGSTLRTPSTYGVRDRTVVLEGEAVFTVVHNEARPFAVITSRAIARDLGTRFVVRAYSGDTQTEVVVAEGLVAVHGRDSAAHATSDSIVITPGERVRVSAEGRLELTRGVALDSYFGWVEGRLVFRDTPLEEVAARLSRWYDVDVRLVSPRNRSQPVTATFERQTAREALSRVGMSLGLDVSQTERTFTLTPR